jgi:hypothetical protein
MMVDGNAELQRGRKSFGRGEQVGTVNWYCLPKTTHRTCLVALIASVEGMEVTDRENGQRKQSSECEKDWTRGL